MNTNNFSKTFIVALILSVMFSISSTNVHADNSGHIGLLTVSESANNSEEHGGVADLYLVVKPGNGRIFIDSFPLSKLDTQITMRFASEIACDLLDKDCSNYDFFYTITASSAVVGGPSAGAAATVLTVAVLDNQELNNKTIMTGTINSGNLIGPVAGIPAKTRAAQQYGYTKALIPIGDMANNTPDENLRINVIRVSTLEDALYYFTGKNYSQNISYDSKYVSEYNKIMSDITLSICTKYGSLDNGVVVMPDLPDYGVTVKNDSTDNFLLALNAINNELYYSAASFCFSGNVKITNALLKNYSSNQLKIEYATLLTNITNFKKELDSKFSNINTISKLETYMIVEQRLSESLDLVSTMNPDNISTSQLAYAIERFNTAVVWSKFYTLSGKEFKIDDDWLRILCTKKLSEAEERLNYMELYYPDDAIRKDLTEAYDYYGSKNYPLCIFLSSKVKADSDVILGAIFISENDTSRLLDEKLVAAQRVMAKQARNNIFPILGYSYYEYANTLKNTDPYSALLYAEYSLEFSNIDMYFEKRDMLNLDDNRYDYHSLWLFLAGVSFGILVCAVFFLAFLISKNKDNSKNNKKPLHRRK